MAPTPPKITADFIVDTIEDYWLSNKKDFSKVQTLIVNSDNGYHEDWLLPLVEWHKKGYLPASRLIESGKMPSGTNGITKYFGSSTENYDEEGFKAWAKSYMSPGILKGGLYMPALFDKNEFLAAGMYPEGNIYNNGIGTCNGRVVIAGDAWFFKKFEKQSVKIVLIIGLHFFFILFIFFLGFLLDLF